MKKKQEKTKQQLTVIWYRYTFNPIQPSIKVHKVSWKLSEKKIRNIYKWNERESHQHAAVVSAADGSFRHRNRRWCAGEKILLRFKPKISRLKHPLTSYYYWLLRTRWKFHFLPSSSAVWLKHRNWFVNQRKYLENFRELSIRKLTALWNIIKAAMKSCSNNLSHCFGD